MMDITIFLLGWNNEDEKIYGVTINYLCELNKAERKKEEFCCSKVI